MAKRQHKSGAFDPDYRRRGWNKSGFAPKNSSMSISQLAFAVAGLVFFAQYLFPQTRKYLLTWDGLWPRAILAFVLWLALGLLLRRVMWIRIRGRIDPAPPTIEFDIPPTAQVETLPRSVSGQDFEHQVAWVLNATTPYKAVVVGGAGDGGVDIKVYAAEQLVGIVQCKRYDMSRPLPPGHIRELYATKQQFGVKTAYLVTTTTFSKESEAEAQRLGIRLIDRDEFARLEIQARKKIKERDERIIESDSEEPAPSP